MVPRPGAVYLRSGGDGGGHYPGGAAFLLYFRLKPLLDSMKTTVNTVAKITSAVETELAGPLAQIVSFVQGIRQAIGLVNRFIKREEED